VVGIGGSIVLIAIGAILAFGVTASIAWLDVRIVGWVMMIVGAIGLAFAISYWRNRPIEMLTQVPGQDYSESGKGTTDSPPDQA
jgi:hypothetical protein